MSKKKRPGRRVRDNVNQENWMRFLEEFEKEHKKSPHEKGTHTGDSLKDMCIIAH